MSNAEYMAEEIGKKLIGCRITGALISDDGESFGFRVENGGPDGPIAVWVDCDPEGNGPGWLSIEEV